MPRAILTYHSIDDSGSNVSTKAAVLRRQLESLVSQGISVVSPSEIVDGASANDRSIAALTFDDGFANFYTEAFPALAAQEVSATVLLVAGKCGQTGDWARQPAALRDRELLTWSNIQELLTCGIRFGAHGMTHAALPALSLEEAASEILESKQRIEDRTGVPVDCFAYPYGEYTPAVTDIVAKNFRVGLSTDMGFVHDGSRPELLERIDAYYLRQSCWFDRLFSPIGRTYIASRSAARGLKQHYFESRRSMK